MTDVIAWPPVSLTARELTTDYPVSRSVALIGGRARTSSAGRPRRLATASVSGYGKDRAGARYVEMLKRHLLGGVHLVRINCLSNAWHSGVPDYQSVPMQWKSGAADVDWTSGGQPLLWSTGASLSGVPTTNGGWPALRVDSFPAGTIVALPMDRISVSDGATTETSTVQSVARANESGRATIRVTEAFTISGSVSIGDRESIVFEALDMPRSAQPLTGDYGYDWSFREVFEDEYPGGWVERDPWR